MQLRTVGKPYHVQEVHEVADVLALVGQHAQAFRRHAASGVGSPAHGHEDLAMPPGCAGQLGSV